MTDLEYAEKIARELIPVPEMAGSAQLRRSIVKAILRARAEEARQLGMELGGWARGTCLRRADDLLSDQPPITTAHFPAGTARTDEPNTKDA